MIDSYLKWLDEHDELDESVFPMDSFNVNKKPLNIESSEKKEDLIEKYQRTSKI